MSGIKSVILLKKDVKTKTKSYGCKITTDFHNKEIP